MPQHNAIAYTSIKDTPTDLGTHFSGHVAVTLDPLTLWVLSATGTWEAVGTPSGDAPPSPASETGAGTVELATEAEVQAGTAGLLVATAARLKAELDRRLPAAEAWISPTLLSGWVSYGTPVEAAGYRKTPAGEVQLKGTIKNGTATTGTTIFTLPVGYRPANQRDFVTVEGGNMAARIYVNSSGNVNIAGVTSNGLLSLESVRFYV
jgi:hypothetical protein